MDRQIQFAHEYNGYDRLAGGPEHLEILLKPAWEAYELTGQVPEWCGVDLLRGWLFYLSRADRHGGGYSLASGGDKVRKWRDVIARLVEHPATPDEHRPPQASLD
jgi:hypothetical protein